MKVRDATSAVAPEGLSLDLHLPRLPLSSPRPPRPCAPIIALLATGAASSVRAAEGLRLTPLPDGDLLPPAAAANAGPAGACLLAGIGVLFIAAMAWRLRRQRARHAAALARAEQRFHQLAEQSQNVVVRLRGEGCEVSANVRDLLGYTPGQVIEAGLASLVHPDDRPHVLASFDALDTCPRIDLAYRLLHRDGGVVFAEATFVRVESAGEAPETLCAIRDVTRHRCESDELRLAIEAARRAQVEADDANKAKSDFLASMSHEVRTPLNAIIGFADLMLAMPDLPPTGRRHAENIRGGGDALLMIVNDILDLSAAEAGALSLDPRPFSLPLLVDKCLSLVEHSALAKKLVLRVDLADRFPAGVVGDEARLRQILLNLLNNAIKFTRQGHITLRIGYDRAGGRDRVRFEIIDTGIGIAAADLPRLFQRFRQVDGTIRRSFGGAGLGLAISKSLVERMGGTIGVQSEPNVGSTFWYAVDLPPAPLELQPAPPPEPSAACVLEILLVEDVAINQELACAILQARGHRVEVVGDGAEAIMAVADKTYDLVLMDVQMPFVDGITATRAIRGLPLPCRFVPIVAMTAAVLAEQVAAARAADMDDVLAKPLSLAALDAVLARAARREVRPALDPAAYDGSIAAKLGVTIGDAKVASMQALLARSLTARFAAEPDADTLAALKAEAHASIAGAAMLGFVRFGALCRAFIATTDQDAAVAAFDALRRELYQVVATLNALAKTDEAAHRAA